METNLANLITAARFVKETGIDPKDFYKYTTQGRVEGLIIVDDCYFVDRTRVNINYYWNGYKFGIWLQIGGRQGPVSVPAYMKERNMLARAGKYCGRVPPEGTPAARKLANG